jgi:hypothetical protein
MMEEEMEGRRWEELRRARRNKRKVRGVGKKHTTLCRPTIALPDPS